MNEDELRKAIQRAREIAQEVPEEIYRPATFDAVLRHLLGERPTGQPNDRETSAPAVQRPLDMQLNEFLATKNPQSHPDRVAAIAHYFFRKDGSGVTTKDIVDAYAKGRLRKPQNVHDVISTCVRRALLVDAEKKDDMRAWMITPTGERYVEALPRGRGSVAE